MGQWIDDKKSGKGVMTWKDDKKYDGEWVGGTMSGKGVFSWADG